MSAFKPFTTADVILSPFKVNKSFSFQGTSELTGSGIDIFEGKNTNPTLWVSGSLPTGYISSQDKFLVYKSIRELYYYNYLEDINGSPIGTASFNEDGTVTGPLYTPNSYNYLTNTLLANRYFPTSLNKTIGIISIPSNKYGEQLYPGTLTLSNGVYTITDDGEGNMFSGSVKVGDIIYSHGMVIITNGRPDTPTGYGYITYGTGVYGDRDTTFISSFTTSPHLTCSFDSTITLYESQYKCTLRENEFNFSQNPTLISGSSNSGVLYDFTTGSYFTPYITSIGLYNNDKELLAIAKLSQPLRISDTTDTSIMINLDL